MYVLYSHASGTDFSRISDTEKLSPPPPLLLRRRMAAAAMRLLRAMLG
jgi:hypothetical protein